MSKTDDAIFDWYETRRKQAEELSRKIEEATWSGVSPVEIRKMRRELDRIRNVGD